MYPGDPIIETGEIQGRSNKSSKLKEEWDKAHAEFKEYAKYLVPQELQIDGEEQVLLREKLGASRDSDENENDSTPEPQQNDGLNHSTEEVECEDETASTASTDLTIADRRVLDPNLVPKSKQDVDEVLQKTKEWYVNNDIDDVMDFKGVKR